ncbi:MAG: glycosyltransferase family 2 protein [Chloroflexi bacterium]|nr:MAG: glycosyltransferase family 2 protein [Chloroflexota bacterium]
MPQVSVVIVNWNGLAFLPACLESLSACGTPVEIIVVDNGSTDGSVEYLRQRPEIVLISNATNTGYAPANNAGIERSTGEFVLLLNNDTRVAPGFLEPLLKVMATSADVGACQCKMLSYDPPYRIDAYGSYLLRTGFLYHLRYGKPDLPAEAPFEIFAAKGAAMLIRAAVLRQVGSFDPDFFAYLEDSDLSWRIWLGGWRVLCVPQSVVYHRAGATASRLPNAFVTFHSFKNRTCMLLKNLSAPSAWRILPVHLALNLGLIAMELIRGRGGAARAVAAALNWNRRHLRTTLRKRRDIQQRIRRVPDRRLLPRITRRVRPAYYWYLLTGGLDRFTE